MTQINGKENMVAINGHIKSWHLADTCQWHMAGLLLALTRWQWSFAENIAPGTITNRKFEPSIADFWRKLSWYHEMFWSVFYVSTNVYFLGGRRFTTLGPCHMPIHAGYFMTFPFLRISQRKKTSEKIHKNVQVFFQFTNRTTLADLKTAWRWKWSFLQKYSYLLQSN